MRYNRWIKNTIMPIKKYTSGQFLRLENNYSKNLRRLENFWVLIVCLHININLAQL
jgi:hypothetical protein